MELDDMEDYLDLKRELRTVLFERLHPALPYMPSVVRAWVITPGLGSGIFPYENIPTNPDAAYIGEIDGIPVYIQNSPW